MVVFHAIADEKMKRRAHYMLLSSYCVIIFILSSFWNPIHLLFPCTQKPITITSPDVVIQNEKVVIGLVVCAGGYGFYNRGQRELRHLSTISENTLTLVRTILMSVEIWNVTRLELHIFTDTWKLTEYIKYQVWNLKLFLLLSLQAVKNVFLIGYRLVQRVGKVYPRRDNIS